MKQLSTYFQVLFISLVISSSSACMKENDTEYAQEPNVKENLEAQPQLIPANDISNPNNQIAEVTLPSAKTREVGEKNHAAEVIFTPSNEQLTENRKNEKTPKIPSTTKGTTSTKPNVISEIPLKPTLKEGEKIKAVPIENVVEPKVIRGGIVSPKPITTSQTRSLPSANTPASNAIQTTKGPIPVMDQEEYDFGNISEGTKVVHVFQLKNTGGEDLYIQDVDAGCNCTTTDYTFEPIKPGASTPIKVTFDSNTKVGTQLKNVVISTNNGIKKVRLRGTVFPKDRNY